MPVTVMSYLKRLYHKILYPEYKYEWDPPTQKKLAPETKAHPDCDRVRVFVGAEKTPFEYSKRQLCKESTYFKTALGPTWSKEGISEAFLEDITKDVFSLISTWLSEGRVYHYSQSRKDCPTRCEYWRQLLQLYLAADYLMMPKLMNDIVDVDACEHRDYNFNDNKTRGKERYVRFWTLEAFVEALEFNMRETPYCKFMLDSCIYGLRYGEEQDENSVQQQLADLQDQHPEVMLDFTRRSLRKDGDNEWKEPNPWFNHFGDYHIHAKGEKCGGSLGN